MADPDPPRALPKYEYIELFNKTSYPISVHGWTISIGSSTKNIPDQVIEANGYLVLSSLTGADSLKKYTSSKVTGISGFPALTNTGTTVVLKDHFRHIVSAVTYSDTWYENASKKGGGWSLELVDPGHPCGGAGNWKSSVHKNGGTPGLQNSVNAINPDTKMPEVLKVVVLNDKYIQVFFDEAIDTTTSIDPDIYSINNGIGSPVKIEYMPPDFLSVKLELDNSIVPELIYSLTVGRSVKDCAGNLFSSFNAARFGIAKEAEVSDIIINEVLFDPLPGGVDFVEVYNRSDKIIDLMSLNLANADFFSGTIEKTERISDEGFLLFPSEYGVLTTRPDMVQRFYSSGNRNVFVKMEKFPSLNITNGHVVLLNANEERIDAFKYTSSMHFALLRETKGVSLERLNPNRPGSDSTNWHSAAQTVGFATPGLQNSQRSEMPVSNALISIDPEIFSPDNDGYQDVLNIRIQPDKPGYIGNVSIFDSEGRKICELAKSKLLGSENIITWDGLTSLREKARVGIYIILAEVFDLNGNVLIYKKVCVVGGKL